MTGILLISHGGLAEGVLSSYRMFNVDEEQIASECFYEQEAPTAFYERIKETCQRIDSGDGVLILCDIPGGTPANMAQMLAAENNYEVISGLNLMMVIDASLSRSFMDLKELAPHCEETGKESVKHLEISLSDLEDEEIEL